MSMPYEKNQILTVEIEDITSEGEGIGKISGYPFFVKDAVIGDTVQIRSEEHTSELQSQR